MQQEWRNVSALHMQLDNPDPEKATKIRMALEARSMPGHWMVRAPHLHTFHRNGLCYMMLWATKGGQ